MNDPFELLPHEELARRRAELLNRIRRQFAIVEVPLHIGPLRLQFTRVADPDIVLDQVVAEEDRRERLTKVRRDGNELHMPYWAELWDSSIGLGEFFAVHYGLGTPVHPLTLSPPHPLHILDLGCGMGLAGTVAAALGHHVCLVDLESPALLFARLNTLPYLRRTSIRKLNWQTDRLRDRFDLILGADVLYERAQWDFLEPFWRAHLAEHGEVLLAEPGRQTGDLFIDWIRDRGWTFKQFEHPMPPRPRPIRIFRISRSANKTNP